MSADASNADSASHSGTAHAQWCGSTHWSVLTMAAQEGAPGAVEALELLCLQYWAPVYAYSRRSGFSPADAEDLTQTFIASFLQAQTLSLLDRSKGRFRSLLLVSLKNFLKNEWSRSQAQKRGGGKRVLSLEALQEEEGFCATAPDLTPDAVFDRRWAFAALEDTLSDLQQEQNQKGHGAEFGRLRIFLTVDGHEDNYNAAATELGMARGAVAMAVHRLRLRFRELLRMRIAKSVNPDQVEDEIRFLITAFRKE